MKRKLLKMMFVITLGLANTIYASEQIIDENFQSQKNPFKNLPVENQLEIYKHLSLKDITTLGMADRYLHKNAAHETLSVEFKKHNNKRCHMYTADVHMLDKMIHDSTRQYKPKFFEGKHIDFYNLCNIYKEVNQESPYSMKSSCSNDFGEIHAGTCNEKAFKILPTNRLLFIEHSDSMIRSRTSAISGLGSTVVGTASRITVEEELKNFRSSGLKYFHLSGKYTSKEINTWHYPIKWVHSWNINNKMKILPGFNNKDINPGEARCVNYDGSVIGGYLVDNESQAIAALWVNNKLYFPQGFLEKKYSYFSKHNTLVYVQEVSPDGTSIRGGGKMKECEAWFWWELILPKHLE